MDNTAVSSEKSPIFSAQVIAQAGYLARSFERLLGRPLVKQPAANDLLLTQQLYDAAAVIVAHGTEADPLFWFANKTAQQLWGMTWDQFSGLPSRLSAEADQRETRAALLAQVQQRGFIQDYAGIRVTRAGKRFRIRDVTVFTVTNDAGQRVGQAATFSTWEWL
jgi:MEKHLA domain